MPFEFWANFLQTHMRLLSLNDDSFEMIVVGIDQNSAQQKRSALSVFKESPLSFVLLNQGTQKGSLKVVFYRAPVVFVLLWSWQRNRVWVRLLLNINCLGFNNVFARVLEKVLTKGLKKSTHLFFHSPSQQQSLGLPENDWVIIFC